ncbi:hypothetical protein TrCOL_g8267 [Triparma columacea]|uniref:Tr-type G domain-containing protein n=1 Tax=Triparma columacea TaxID=722753 RepID=A0A9W7G6V8_9STRA|nr:hypothetical protein TrCOL_g8267 [Triparma columacea]
MTESQTNLLKQSRKVLKDAKKLSSPILDSATTSKNTISANTISSETSTLEGTGLEDSAFLVVVAGEFNSGKSTFINALIGELAMATGPLPTTDRLVIVGTNIRDTHTNDETLGLTYHHTPSNTSTTSTNLEDVTLVDTPGTNAVSELGHTALTRRLLPNADLVVFVTSAEQAMSESERGVLEVVKGWGKRVVVVLNKVDILTDKERVEVEDFVRRKTFDVFDKDIVSVVGVSSKKALQSKLTSARDGARGDPKAGTGAKGWEESGFNELEDVLAKELSDEKKVNTKMLNPLGVADSLVRECEDEVGRKLRVIKMDEDLLGMVGEQCRLWGEGMGGEGVRSEGRCEGVFKDILEEGVKEIQRIGMGELAGGGWEGEDLIRRTEWIEEIEVKVIQQVRGIVRQGARNVSEGARQQSDNVVGFLSSNPMQTGGNVVGKIAGATNERFNEKTIEREIWEGIEGDLGKYATVAERVRGGIEDARNRVRGGLVGMAAGIISGGAGFNTIGGAATGGGMEVGGMIGVGVGLGAVCLGLGGLGTARGRVGKVWREEIEGWGEKVGKNVGRGVDMASEGARGNVEMLLRPYGNFLKEGRKVNEGWMKELEGIKRRSREIRRGVESGGGGWGGGFRE